MTERNKTFFGATSFSASLRRTGLGRMDGDPNDFLPVCRTFIEHARWGEKMLYLIYACWVGMSPLPLVPPPLSTLLGIGVGW